MHQRHLFYVKGDWYRKHKEMHVTCNELGGSFFLGGYCFRAGGGRGVVSRVWSSISCIKLVNYLKFIIKSGYYYLNFYYTNPNPTI